MRRKLILYFLFIFFCSFSTFGQFYNGHQMQFGKNRVQFNDFYWTYYRYDKFDTYFNEYGQKFARYTAEFTQKEIDRLERLFDYHLESRIIFIVYNKLSDFRQSNIGLVTGKTESNIGGKVQIDRNKVFLYFEGNYQDFEEQITAAISQVIIYEIIYGNGFRESATNSTLINLPKWYIDGLTSYVSRGWSFEYENKIKDGIISGKYKRFNRLEGDDAMYAGHSFWQYISETYGESVIPSILYLTRVNKSANSGIFYVLGSQLKELSRNWYEYNLDVYSQQDASSEFPTTPPLKKKPLRKTVYHHIKLSPSGNTLAYVTNQMGKYKVWVYDLKTGKKKKLISKEHKLEQITDYSYPILAWHPSGRILTFITEEKGGLKMYYYTFGEKEIISRNILYFEKVLSYSFSPDGSLIAISAVKFGQSDIYIHNIAAGTNLQVTNDISDDSDPNFINNGRQVIFASNRKTDSISAEANMSRRGFTQDIFIYDYETRSDKLKRLADIKYINKSQPIEIAHNKYISLSDKNGIVNRYISKFDSTISSVDTIIHYRYFAETEPNTNYSRNISEHDFDKSNNKLAEVIFNKGRYYLFAKDFDDTEVDKGDLKNTPIRKIQTRLLSKKDSLDKIKFETIILDSLMQHGIVVGSDSLNYTQNKIDINNYTFEVERIKMINDQFKEKKINVTVVESAEKTEPRARIYQKAFYQNYVVTQLDFTFLSESYQTFTGSAVYYNPGANLLFKIGTYDLFEDFKITAGMRLPLDFQSSEYLLSFENLKKRLDKQFFFHRQTFDNYTTGDIQYVTKNITHQLSAVFRYPFSQVTSVLGTVNLRNDKTVFYPLSLNSQTADLTLPNIDKLWGSVKGEYIFDNTRNLGLNLPAGTRFKIFGEVYQQINKNYLNLFVVGADFRHYTIIHRNLIWANRFAASASLGSSRLVYYLGGVDNWLNFSQRTPTFIPLSEIRLTPDVTYAYQTVATNMRGFSQNIRNGSNFMVFNTELRLPIIRYFANYPLSNAFFENFQVAGFFDIGTAWSGLSPWSNENGYDRDYINRNFENSSPVEVEIDAQRDPIVAGYGFGARSQLLGYFIRLDWAWGIENMQVLPRVFYLSLSLDF